MKSKYEIPDINVVDFRENISTGDSNPTQPTIPNIADSDGLLYDTTGVSANTGMDDF